METIKKISYLKITAVYLIASALLLLLSWYAFYFPVHQIFDLLGIEFSNLGPIATLSWGVVVILFLLTPAFVLTILLKVFNK